MDVLLRFGFSGRKPEFGSLVYTLSLLLLSLHSCSSNESKLLPKHTKIPHAIVGTSKVELSIVRRCIQKVTRINGNIQSCR